MSAKIDLEVPLVTTDDDGAWVYAIVPDAAAAFGTRKAVKVAGTLDGTPVAVTLLPMGDGSHMLPVKAATRKAIGKTAGDVVHVQLHAVQADR